MPRSSSLAPVRSTLADDREIGTVRGAGMRPSPRLTVRPAPQNEERGTAMATILDTVRGLLTPEVTARAASLLGESESGVSRGLSAAIPAILSSLLAKAGDSSLMQRIMSLLTDPGLDPNLGRSIGSMLTTGGLAQTPATDLGQRFLSMIFGDRLAPVASALAEYAGLRSSTASSLLGMAGPLVMSVLGDRVRKDGLDAKGPTSLLSSPRGGILPPAPPALSRPTGPRMPAWGPTPALPREGA